MNIKEFVLSLIRRYRIIALVYSAVSFWYCKLYKSKINLYDTLVILCDAQRRIPDFNITKKINLFINTIIKKCCLEKDNLLPIAKNKLIDAFYESNKFKIASEVFKNESDVDKLHLRHFRNESAQNRQGNIIIVKKPNLETGEKGVIIIKYTPTFEHFAAVFDLRSICNEYRIVFEPSSYRNIEASLFLYNGFSLVHVMQAAQNDDKKLLELIPSSIHTIDLGSGDWADINTFKPINVEKVYDIVMVASWLRLKRHYLLFESLKELKMRGLSLKVALVGYPMDIDKEYIEKMARSYGVYDSCDIYERVPPSEVRTIVASSRMALHLSKYEGTNKAAYEAWLCDVPLIVCKNNSGFRNNYINSYTGVLSDDSELPGAILHILHNEGSFSPRSWILEHSGHLKSTFKLNNALMEIALENGEPWTTDIVAKKNEPNAMYVNDEDCLLMEPSYLALEAHLVKV